MLLFFLRIIPSAQKKRDTKKNRKTLCILFFKKGLLKNFLGGGVLPSSVDCCLKGGARRPVHLSFSKGVGDITEHTSRTVAYATALYQIKDCLILRLPQGDSDDSALSLVDSWRSTLEKHGLFVSTGPVVAFRGVDYQGGGTKAMT